MGRFYISFGLEIHFPKVSAHIDMTVGLEGDAFFLEERSLPLPARSRATLDVDDSVAGQLFSPGRVPKRSPHHSGMTGPTGQSSDEAVGHHAPWRNLRHDAQHRIAKLSSFLNGHLYKS